MWRTVGCPTRLRHISQPFYFKHLRNLEYGRQLVLRDIHLAVVHEVHHRPEIFELDVFQYDDGVLARVHRE